MLKTKKIISSLGVLLILSVCAATAGYRFYNGEDWSRLNTKYYPKNVKMKAKELLLKATQDASFFSGDPILPKDEKNITSYLDTIDKFYDEKTNSSIPLYFALKIATMQRQRMPQKQIELYKMAVLKRIQAQQ